MSRFLLLALGINGFLTVGFGAFGAHALEARLSAAQLQTWHTAVQYQMFHSLGLLAVAWLVSVHGATAALRWSGWLFVAGLVLFCGSLYALALSGVSMLGAITPIGGVAWLVAWLLLAKSAFTQAP